MSSIHNQHLYKLYNKYLLGLSNCNFSGLHSKFLFLPLLPTCTHNMIMFLEAYMTKEAWASFKTQPQAAPVKWFYSTWIGHLVWYRIQRQEGFSGSGSQESTGSSACWAAGDAPSSDSAWGWIANYSVIGTDSDIINSEGILIFYLLGSDNVRKNQMGEDLKNKNLSPSLLNLWLCPCSFLHHSLETLDTVFVSKSQEISSFWDTQSTLSGTNNNSMVKVT